MPARVPLDVDLEDKLIYGLTPARLAYMVFAMLAGLGMWSSTWSPTPIRASAASACIGIGAVVSWGTWRGRAADVWIADLVLFCVRTHRVTWNWAWIHSMLQKLGSKQANDPTAVAT